jgi:autophagy-related protein 17
VVMDLREILNEMEAIHEAILERVTALATNYNEAMTAYKILEEVGGRLSNYFMSSQEFRFHWEETKQNIMEQLTELESMRVFYENYSASYDDLILEVSRRKTSQDKIKQIARRAMEQIEKVYEADVREREEFRIDSGEYLPADLWPGVHVTPPKWEFGLVDEKDGTVPELGESVIEAAGKRNRVRDRTES